MDDEPTETLWAALDPDTEELRALIHSDTSGVYSRVHGQWVKYDDDDTSLDGLESIDVTDDFISAFDEAPEGSISRDDVLEYEAGDGDGDGADVEDSADAQTDGEGSSS